MTLKITDACIHDNSEDIKSDILGSASTLCSVVVSALLINDGTSCDFACDTCCKINMAVAIFLTLKNKYAQMKNKNIPMLNEIKIKIALVSGHSNCSWMSPVSRGSVKV